ncbi:SIR2 family protein [Aliarcobacter butzleri]|uniref:SIR2 family protein n=1 Tax=Aliarcobacter butzleri TaxID=28197 RepID=UPI003AF456C7
MKIIDIPELPEGLKKAAEKGELVIFIGAGMSYSLGCKSWNHLASELINTCENLDNKPITHIEATQLRNLLNFSGNNKKIITICEKILEESGEKNKFIQTMKESLNDEKVKIDNPNLESYRDLFKLNGIFVTTNADRHINQLFNDENIIIEKFNKNTKLENKNLYKIHGCIQKIDTLIFTVEQYFKVYGDRGFTRFLEKLFTKTVLFIGYGLGEFELLEFMFKNIHISKERFYYLTGYFTYEEQLCTFEQLYFKQLGIKLIPYSKDLLGHNQLNLVLKDWVERITNTTNILQINFDDIDEALRNPNKKNILAVIQQINNNEHYKKYFFSQANKYRNLNLWLKPLKSIGIFEKIDDILGIYIFLKEVSIQNRNKYKNDIGDILLELLDNYFNKRIFSEKNLDLEYVDIQFIEILFNLKKDKIDIKYLSLIDDLICNTNNTTFSLVEKIKTCILPAILENKMKEHLNKLLETIFKYKNIEKYEQINRYSILEDYFFEELIKNRFNDIINVVDKNIFLDILINNVNQIIKEDKEAFNTFSIRTIEEHSQRSLSDNYDNNLISSIRDLLLNMKRNQLRKILINFLNEESSIFQRIALYIIDKRYSEFKKIYWDKFNILKLVMNGEIKYEVFKLLENNSSTFNPQEINKVISWIESLTYYAPDYKNESKKEIEKHNLYKRKEWLLTLKNNNKKANDLYEKYHKIVPWEHEHPGFDIYISEFKVLGKSSNKEEQEIFCNQSIDDIIIELNKIHIEDNNEDLLLTKARDFSNCIKFNSNKIINDIDKFISVDDMFKYYMMIGLEEALREKREFNWKNLFNFLLKLLEDNLNIQNENYSLLFWRKVANLIRSSVKDNNSFEDDLLHEVKNILDKLLQYREKEVLDNRNDLLTHTLNSYNGNILHSYMEYLIRYAKSFYSSNEIKWEDDTKNFFTNELNRNKDDYSKIVFIILGYYLPYFSFLDKKWVEINFTKIFPVDDKVLLKIILGAFFRNPNIYLSYYELLKNNNYFEIIFNDQDLCKSFKRKATEYIVYAYIDEKDEQTIFKILKDKKDEIIKEIVNIFAYMNQNNNIKIEILKLWRIIYNLYKEDYSDKADKIFVVLLNWIKILDNIDFELQSSISRGILKSNPHSLYNIIDEFIRLSQNNHSQISEIILYISEKNYFFYYQENKIIELFKILKGKEPEIFLKIQNCYRKNSFYFVNNI